MEFVVVKTKRFVSRKSFAESSVCLNLFFRFENIGIFLTFFLFFLFVCARSLTKPFFRPSQPGSCA